MLQVKRSITAFVLQTFDMWKIVTVSAQSAPAQPELTKLARDSSLDVELFDV